MVFISLPRLFRGENGLTKGLAMVSGSYATHETLQVVAMVRYLFGVDPWPNWLLMARVITTVFVKTPTVTYLMKEMGFFEMLMMYLKGDEDDEETTTD